MYKLPTLLAVAFLLMFTATANAQVRPTHEVSVFPVTDCTNINWVNLRHEVAGNISNDHAHPQGPGRAFGHPVDCPVLVFKYFFDNQVEARRFARNVASNGLERLIAGTTPRAGSTLTIYPTIRKITVRKFRQ